MKNHLFRDRAPITEAGWEEIEKEATRTLRTLLAARRVVDFRGPLGWGASDVELGRADPIASPPGGSIPANTSSTNGLSPSTSVVNASPTVEW